MEKETNGTTNGTLAQTDSSSPDAHPQGKETYTNGDRKPSYFDLDPAKDNVAAAFENPLALLSKEQLMEDVEKFCRDFDLMDQLENMKKGALVSQNPSIIDTADFLTEEERSAFQRETTHKWKHPFMLYFLTFVASMAAATQGMDETANNGALPIYIPLLSLESTDFNNDANKASLIQGLVVSAPYLACAVIGCWMTQPMNALFGRRGTIWISCFIAAVASIGEAFSQSWPGLFAARFVLGLGIGAKSATVPIYAAETAPPLIRGALVMQWQVWTAFGIMFGNIVGVAFGGLRPDLAWRLILGSTVVPPAIVCAIVYLCPESPRWYLTKGRGKAAFHAFRRLRNTDIQACRETYYTYVGVELEHKVNKGKNLFTQFIELFTINRNRRATWATWIVMFGQQFCGVNIIAYYSTTIFRQSGYSLNSALLASMGTGILNWVFALPAFFTIDRYGRRPLLIITFPFLAIFLLWTGMSFFINQATHPKARIGMITAGLYLFEVFYSPGMGPVPFSYSAEAFPMHVRDVGVSWATATTWCFNFIIAFTFPSLLNAFKPQGAFGWYAAWCVILWVLVILFVPETKQLTLEELDQVFSVPTRKHASYQVRNSIYHFRRYVLFDKHVQPLPPLYGSVGRSE